MWRDEFNNGGGGHVRRSLKHYTECEEKVYGSEEDRQFHFGEFCFDWMNQEVVVVLMKVRYVNPE